MKSYIARACITFLAVGSLAAGALTSSVAKASPPRAPEVRDLQGLQQNFPASESVPAMIIAQTSATANSGGSVVSNAASATLPILAGYVPDDKYKLRVGDKVSFQIIEDRDAPRSLVVADSGELDVPYLGRVLVADKTCKQLADELKAQLEKEYYYRATVIIALDVANKLLGRIYVWGQVRSQGPMDIGVNENLTVGKAILRAGGFADFANKKKVKLVRAAGVDGAPRLTMELNMVDILEKGAAEKDIILQPDDFIIVPSRLISF